MKKILLHFLLTFICFHLYTQTTYTSISDGNWNDDANWVTVPAGEGSPGATPPANSTIIVNNDLSLFGSLVLNQGNISITINNPGSVDIAFNLAYATSASSITGDGLLTVDGSFNVNSSTGHTLGVTTIVGTNFETGNNVGFTSTADLTITENASIDEGADIITSNFDVNGNLSISGNGTTFESNGDVVVTGTLDINNQGDATFNNNLTVTGNASLTGSNVDVIVGGDAVFNANFSIANQADLDVTGDLTINGAGTFTVNGSDTDLNVGGNVTLGSGDAVISGQGDLSITGSFTNTGNLDIVGSDTDFIVGGSVSTGELTLSGQADATISGDLTSLSVTVTGSGTDLIIDGASLIDGDVTVSGQANIDFGTDTSISGNLTVTGSGTDVTLGNGDTNIGGNILIENQADIIGTTGVLGFNTITITGNGSNIVCGSGSLDEDDAIPNPVDLATCGAGVLPITLNFFEVNQVKDDFFFTWQTLTELNNDFFTIEFSYDAENFEILTDQIYGAGNSYSPINYDYLSTGFIANGNVIFFRLKQTDFDGEFSYSPIISIELGDEIVSSFQLFPNPANDFINLLLVGIDEESTSVNIINSISLTVEQTVPVTNTETRIDISNLNSGVYLIKIDGLSTVKKLVVH